MRFLLLLLLLLLLITDCLKHNRFVREREDQMPNAHILVNTFKINSFLIKKKTKTKKTKTTTKTEEKVTNKSTRIQEEKELKGPRGKKE